MEKTETLAILKMYYSRSRGVGHTQLMLNGLNNSNEDFMLILPRGNDGRHVLHKIRREFRVATLDNLEPLKGFHGPLSMDHSTISCLLEMFFESFRGLQEENQTLRAELHDAYETIREVTAPPKPIQERVKKRRYE